MKKARTSAVLFLGLGVLSGCYTPGYWEPDSDIHSYNVGTPYQRDYIGETFDRRAEERERDRREERKERRVVR